MDLLTPLLPSRWRATYQPWDDFWFNPLGSRDTVAGVAVSPETAMRLSAVYACVRILASLVGSLPLLVYRRLDNGGKERALTSPLHRLLHRQPNPWQTSYDWRRYGQMCLLLRGNFYSAIGYDGRGAVTRILPLHPDRVKVRLLESGRRGYTYRPPNGRPEETFTQDEILHVMGLSLDGVTGLSVIEYAREAISAGQAQEAWAATFWRQGAELPGFLTHPGRLSDTAQKNIQKSVDQRLGGRGNAHRLQVLEEGMKFEKVGVSGRDAQYIESRQFSVSDIARFFGVPPHMIGDVDRSTSWGTGIEQQALGFVNFTLLPEYLVNWEQAIDRDLVIPDDQFVEFLVDALLRGDMAARSTAYATYVQNGIMSENEVRVRENLNPYPGLDVPQRSANQGRTDAGATTPARPSAPAPRRPADDEDEDDDTGTRARAIVQQTAARLVRREIAALRQWAPRFAADPPGWEDWLGKFYDKHAAVVEEGLCVSASVARHYCVIRCRDLHERGVAAAETWDAAPLVALAMGGQA